MKHTIWIEFTAWQLEVEVDCTHEGDAEVRPTMHDPGCPATGPEFDVTAVMLHNGIYGAPVPAEMIEDLGLTERVRAWLVEELEAKRESDEADQYRQERQDEQDAYDADR